MNLTWKYIRNLVLYILQSVVIRNKKCYEFLVTKLFENCRGFNKCCQYSYFKRFKQNNVDWGTIFFLISVILNGY